MPQTTAPLNGDAPTLKPDAPPVLELADDDGAFLTAARQRLTAARARHEQIKRDLADAGETVKRWEKVVRDLDPDPPAGTGPSVGRAKRTAHPTGVGAARLAQIETVIREITTGDLEHEFRPTDIRARLADSDRPISSGAVSQALLKLRESQVVRFSRREGNSHYYRLTRVAAREG